MSDADWATIGAHLDTIRRGKVLELRNYPQAIGGCNVQFNKLAEEREAIFGELERLEEACASNPGSLEEFLRSPPSSKIDHSA